MKYQSILKPCFCYNEKSMGIQDSQKESGFDRVKRMYQLNDYGLMSPEMFFLLRNAASSVIAASIVGAFIYSNKARDDYFRKNVATTYESQHLARRSLSDTMTLSAFKGGYKYAVKYGSFSSAYLMSTMTIASYNNKITIWEHIGTGALLGGILRLKFGLKGMAVAAGLGSFLGAFTGGILVLFMRINNLTLEELRSLEAEKYYAMRRKRYSES